MKYSARICCLLTAISAFVPAVALAHPGHDDGHELTWDLSHLAAHPLATLGCATVMLAGAWIMWRLARRPECPSEKATKPAVRL